MLIKNSILLILFLIIAGLSSAQKTTDKLGAILPSSKSVFTGAAVSIAERTIIDLILQTLLRNRKEKNNILFGSNDIGHNKIDTVSLLNNINKGRHSTKIAEAQFSSFFISSIERANNIFWSTNTEKNVAGYMIERSADGNIFNAVGSMNATNTKILQQYTFTDVKIKDTITYSYRIRVIGTNRESQFFVPIKKGKSMLSVNYHLDNAKKLLYINSPTPILKMEVMDIDGEIKITQKKINLIKPIETNTLLPGVYTIKVYTDNNVVSQLFFRIE